MNKNNIMKTKLLIAFCLTLSLCSFAQNVTIPDTILKGHLVGNPNINTNGDSEIQVSEAAAYTGVISAAGIGIQDLTGIEAFTEIVALQVQQNHLSFIDVSQNTKLRQLLLENNDDLAGYLDLSSHTLLTDVKVHTTSLTAVNIANGNNLNFTRFEAQNSTISCVQVDNGFTPGNGWLANNGGVYSETCFTSCIVTIPDTLFKSFLVNNSNINTNGNNEIECSEASSFRGELFLVVLNIQDLTGIEGFTSLTSLNCSETGLSSIDVSSNIALAKLNISNTQIATLDLSANSQLNEFIGVNTALTSLDVSTNSMLSRIIVGNNSQLANLNVANGNNNTITDSDFFASNCPNLTCITVDDVAYSDANWTNVDAQTSFSLNCSANTDTTPPVAVCQDVTIQLTTAGNATIVAGDINNGSTDDVAIGAFSVSPSSFSCLDIGSNTVTFTVTDTSGNTDTCTAIVTVEDTINPSIVQPADISQNIDTGMCSAFVSFPIIIVNDNCSSTSFTTDAPSDQVFPVGTTTVTVTGMDDSGNTDTKTFDITVVDNQIPELSCLADFTVAVEQGALYNLPDFIANGDITATDNCNIQTITQTPTAGSQIGIGQTTVTVEVIDDSGNINSCSFILTVDQTLSVNDSELGIGINVYPNPAHNELTVLSNSGVYIETTQIIDMAGRIVTTIAPSDTINRTIEISSLKPGVYFLRIESPNVNSMIKFIKK